MPTRTDAVTITGPDLDATAPNEDLGLSRAITAGSEAARAHREASYYVRDQSGEVVGQVVSNGNGCVIYGPRYFAAGGQAQDAPPVPLPQERRPAVDHSATSTNGKEPDMAPSDTEVKPDPKEKAHQRGPKKQVGGAAPASDTGKSEPKAKTDGKAKSEPKAKATPKPAAAASSDGKAKKVPAKQAAVDVLKKNGGPLHVDELVKRVLDTKGVKLGGKTPGATIAAMLAVENKKADGLFVRTDKATYDLRERASK
jgi:HB1/ASXL restriction endonuclease-like protein with HTH domain